MNNYDERKTVVKQYKIVFVYKYTYNTNQHRHVQLETETIAVEHLSTPADPGGRTRRARPPNGRGPMIFYAQNANFSQFFRRSLRSRLILSIIIIEIWPKTR